MEVDTAKPKIGSWELFPAATVIRGFGEEDANGSRLSVCDDVSFFHLLSSYFF
jgi:hypothetical protein